MGAIGLGLVTYGRPEIAADTYRNIAEVLGEVVDAFVEVNDAAQGEALAEFMRAGMVFPGTSRYQGENRGVSAVKNLCIDHLIAYGCEHIFLVEDDKVFDDPKAITEYVRVANANGLGHLSWRPPNAFDLRRTIGDVAVFNDHHGGFGYFRREAIEAVRLDNGQVFDEGLVNAFEHIDLAMRLYQAGAIPLGMCWPDVVGSDAWLHDRGLPSTISSQPGYIDEHIPRMHARWYSRPQNLGTWMTINREADLWAP